MYESRSSINFLTAHARFTATLNGGTLMDNFYTTSPVLTLARSAFEHTDAVVRADSIGLGMRRMLQRELPWADERKRRQRQVVCWYRRMSLNVGKAAEENLAVLQAHLDALELTPRLVL